jgi:sensor domain CHASE-containing protein
MIATTTLLRRRNAVAITTGSINLMIGLTVLIGYAVRNALLVTFLPGFAPMRFTTAIGILCCGAAVLLLATGASRLATAMAVICGAIGLATLIEVIAGVHIAGFGPAAFAGAAPPSSGLLIGVLLVSAATALALMSGVVRLRSRLAIVGFIGSVLHSVGVVAVFSYVAGVSSAFTVGTYSQLAIHTSVATAALGAGLIRFAWRDSICADRGAPAWAPLLVGAGTLSTAFCLYGAIAADQKSDFAHQVRFDAEGIRQFLHAGLDSRIQPLIWMARRRAIAPTLKREDWDADAQTILTRGGYRAIEWIDPAGRVLWASPPGTGDATADGSAMFEARRRAAFEEARQKRELAATRPVDLVTGGKGTIVVVPVFVRDELAGYVAGVFRYQSLFQNLLASNTSSRHAIVIGDGGEGVFAQGSPAKSVDLSQRMELILGGRTWDLEIAPTEALVVQEHSPVAGGLLVSGAFLSLLFAFLVYLLQRSGVSPDGESAAVARIRPTSPSDVEGMPVVSYDQDGSARSWNEMANHLFIGVPPGISHCEMSFRSVQATLLRASAAPTSLETLRGLLESCAQPTVVFDADGRLVATNAAAARVLGWSDAAWAARDASPVFTTRRDGLEIQNVLLIQGRWAVPVNGSALEMR